MNAPLNKLTVQVSINAPMEKIWHRWTFPEHISRWNNMDENWHCPIVENDLKEGGRFLYRMETRDGRQSFDHCGEYDTVVYCVRIEYTLTDGRKVSNSFRQEGEQVIITEVFDPETQTPVDDQRMFCQSVLNSFKNYVESNE